MLWAWTQAAVSSIYHPRCIWNNKQMRSLRWKASSDSEYWITALRGGSYFCLPFTMCMCGVFKHAQTFLNTLCSRRHEQHLTRLLQPSVNSLHLLECLHHIWRDEWQRRLCTWQWVRVEYTMSRRRLKPPQGGIWYPGWYSLLWSFILMLN